MNKTEATELTEALIGMFEVFGATISERGIATYLRILSDYPVVDVIRAIDEALRTLRFLPKPAEITDIIAQKIVGDTGVATEQAALVLRTIRSVGTYAPKPKFDDPITDHVVETLGWKALGMLTPEGLQEQVRINYQTFRKRALAEVQTGRTEDVAAAIDGHRAEVLALPEGDE